jgi:hypothetical protein
MLELAEFLPEPVFRNALDHVIAGESDAFYRCDARLASVSRRLVNLGDVRRALKLALKIRDRFLLTRTTRYMAGALGQLSRERLLDLWSADLQLSKECCRHDAFGFVAALGPLVHALGGQKAILQLYETIAETGRWWY